MEYGGHEWSEVVRAWLVVPVKVIPGGCDDDASFGACEGNVEFPGILGQQARVLSAVEAGVAVVGRLKDNHVVEFQPFGLVYRCDEDAVG